MLNHLTDREREVAQLIAEGLQNKEIARRLVISKYTVRTHIEHIFAKFDIASRTELAILYVQAGRME